jgi:hypothetical protein
MPRGYDPYIHHKENDKIYFVGEHPLFAIGFVDWNEEYSSFSSKHDYINHDVKYQFDTYSEFLGFIYSEEGSRWVNSANIQFSKSCDIVHYLNSKQEHDLEHLTKVVKDLEGVKPSKCQSWNAEYKKKITNSLDKTLTVLNKLIEPYPYKVIWKCPISPNLV